jgi:hypothetical protein
LLVATAPSERKGRLAANLEAAALTALGVQCTALRSVAQEIDAGKTRRDLLFLNEQAAEGFARSGVV